MKNLLILLALFTSFSAFAGPSDTSGNDGSGPVMLNKTFTRQAREQFLSHNYRYSWGTPNDSTSFITYDTTIVYPYDPYHTFNYHLRITRPTNLFTVGSPDTASRQMFWAMPGVGEMGTDLTKLYAYGPHYWLANGWNGGVLLGNGEHFPILVTAICEVTQPPPTGTVWIINYLINHYHIKRGGVHMFGLSEGAFTNGYALGVTDTTGTWMTGADVGMRNITSATFLSGVASSNPGPTPAQYSEMGHWAVKYNGRAFFTVGYSDAQAPYPPLAATQMNDSVPGSAYFAYNSVDGGAHGGWNTEYDPNLVLWNSGATGYTPAGTYVTTSTSPNTQGAYRSPGSLFQNALRMGDTSLAYGGSTPPTYGPTSAVEVISGEYVFGVHAQNDTLYALLPGNTTWAPVPLPSGQLIKTGSVGFNNFRLITKTGNYYKTSNYNVAPTTMTQTTLDTTGAAFSNCLAVWTDIESAVVLRSDSSLWLTDNDTLFIVHSSGTYVITKPMQLSQPGVKYRHVSMGPNGIYGTTTDGKIYLWAANSHTISPTLVWPGTPVRAMMTSTANPNAVVAIMRNLTGDTTCGRVYAQGTSWGDWGGTGATYSTFTDITTSILGLPRGVRHIQMNTNALTVVDSLGYLYAVAKCNSQGELGNGVEYVNQYNYVGGTYPGIGWSFNNTENPVAGPATLIGGTNKFIATYGNPFFTFYKFAIDTAGNTWFWGRNKTISADGNQMVDADNAAHPNALDVTKPKKVNVFTQGITVQKFTTPSASAGTNQSIGTSSTTLTAGGIGVTLTLSSNALDTLNYPLVAWAWTQTSGAACTITSPTSKTTTVTGLATGVYHFQVLETDANGGQDTAGVTVTVNIPVSTPPTVSAGTYGAITLPVNSVTLAGSAGANNPATSITSYAWTQVSGPSTGSFSSTSTTNPVFSGLIAGTYVVKLTAVDNLGGTNSANASITVNPAVIPPAGTILQLRVRFTIKQP